MKILIRIRKEVSEERNESCAEKMCFFLINELGYTKSLSPHILKCYGMRCSFATTKGSQIANLMIKRDKKKKEEKGEGREKGAGDYQNFFKPLGNVK